MPVELNHTIVAAADNTRSSRFVAELLGLDHPTPFGPFQVVEAANGVSLDFITTSGRIHPQHYAFLVTDDEFDAIFGRIQGHGMDYWADPGKRRKGEINHNDGGRGCYFEDLDGHFLEIITRPYGSGS
jgi:catechol 2,3-dioxygenase-like lactoylglutathione lyase family enzyme